MRETTPHFEHRDKPGHVGEENLEKFFEKYEKLGAIVKIREEDYGKDLNLKVDGYCRTCEETDSEEHTDFIYYRAHNKSWHKWDITSEKDSKRRDAKTKRNAALGIKTPFLPLYILRDAAKSRATLVKENLSEAQEYVFKELIKCTEPDITEPTSA